MNVVARSRCKFLKKVRFRLRPLGLTLSSAVLKDPGGHLGPREWMRGEISDAEPLPAVAAPSLRLDVEGALCCASVPPLIQPEHTALLHGYSGRQWRMVLLETCWHVTIGLGHQAKSADQSAGQCRAADKVRHIR